VVSDTAEVKRMKNVTPRKPHLKKKVLALPAPNGFWDEEGDMASSITAGYDDSVRAAIEHHVKVFKPSPPSPEGFFTLSCGDHRFFIMDALDGSRWDDLLCYDMKLTCSVHLRRQNLMPKERVDAAIEFLKSINSTFKDSL